ncbi:hypothetical protein B0H15DRAFT_796072 [Mycena belliarum]|uniref:Ribonuclease H1 N-terminal domain-containing protein n=1 Tax=Mycena belliarum TaxID=1033014 RepID=A0AAD6XUT7_9AGAR|nr:hypothetical protein B0H15DRAFT_796072 [Mycena belliae]
MSSSTPTSVRAATPQMEVAALAAQLKSIALAVVQAQAHLTEIVLGTTFVPVPSFVEGVAPTPQELAAAFPAHEDSATQAFYVVLRGRDPGLYLSAGAAEAQTKGVPNQKMFRKTGRDEALAFYAANYPLHIKKWVQIPAPVPSATPAGVNGVSAEAGSTQELTSDWVNADAEAAASGAA